MMSLSGICLASTQGPRRLIENFSILCHSLVEEFISFQSHLDEMPQGLRFRKIGSLFPVLGNISRLHAPRSIAHVKNSVFVATLTPDNRMSPLVGMVIILKNTIHLELLEQRRPFPPDIGGISLYPGPPGWAVIADKLPRNT